MIDALTMPFTLLCGMTAVYGLVPARARTSAFANANPAIIARSATITIALLVVAFLAKLEFVNFDTNSTAIEAPLCLLLLATFTLTVPRIRPMQALYVAAWAQILAEMGFECVDLVTNGLSEPAHVVCRTVLSVLCAAALYAACRRWLAPQLQVNGSYLIGRRKLAFVVAIVILFLLLSNYQLIFLLIGSRGHSYMVPAFRLMTGTLSLAALYLQNDIEKRQQAQLELNMVQQLWQRQQSQYATAKENIDIINRKCHDLKYQLAAFRAMRGDTSRDDAEIDRKLGEVERSVMIYDATFDTGNPVLDVVLTEKSLYCEAHHITMTCMADGKALDFLDKADVYALFGNAIDNAIESVAKQQDPNKRVIQVSAYADNGFLMIRFRNYCDVPVTIGDDGLPTTSKTHEPGYHGYGLRGIRYTAEQYGGTMDIHIEPESFTLRVMIPVPTGA
ncbi:ATP-binding protein [Bifidobacterium aerophilum]|uniref:GHKL domain-containing protein n=1 Tax=Bifidobacterium aerophilum TaxID=1798155 RepID=A0A6N9Z5X5_9BIFI|nr:ATP-binding protein [Bifidobacterium aerophilum]NEG89515.1 GHKL domain-containing protein [Bifidobacterium aerophilum]